MKHIKLYILAGLLAFPLSALSDEFLNGEQIKELFSNVTYDIEKVQKKKKNLLKSYTSEDGERLVYIPWKNKISNRKWWVKKDKFCGSHPKKGDFCIKIKNTGNGIFHSFKKGKHRSILSNFQEGNQL